MLVVYLGRRQQRQELAHARQLAPRGRDVRWPSAAAVPGRKTGERQPVQVSRHQAGKNFFIGCVLGDASATDPNYGRSSFFPGQIDEVKVYSRALTPDAVKAHFDAGVKDLSLTAEYRPVKQGKTIRQDGVTVRVGGNGQVAVQVGKDSYMVESAFSYPGERIGWNRFSGVEPGGEAVWTRA